MQIIMIDDEFQDKVKTLVAFILATTFIRSYSTTS